jgi:hypothetical protein
MISSRILRAVSGSWIEERRGLLSATRGAIFGWMLCDRQLQRGHLATRGRKSLQAALSFSTFLQVFDD